MRVTAQLSIRSLRSLLSPSVLKGVPELGKREIPHRCCSLLYGACCSSLSFSLAPLAPSTTTSTATMDHDPVNEWVSSVETAMVAAGTGAPESLAQFGSDVPFAEPYWYRGAFVSPYYTESHVRFRAKVRPPALAACLRRPTRTRERSSAAVPSRRASSPLVAVAAAAAAIVGAVLCCSCASPHEAPLRWLPQVRSWIETEAAPFNEQWEQEGDYPRELHQKAYAAGIYGACWPEEYGGTPPDGPGTRFDAFHDLVYWDEIARGGGGWVAACFLTLNIALPPILALGSDHMKATVRSRCRGATVVPLAGECADRPRVRSSGACRSCLRWSAARRSLLWRLPSRTPAATSPTSAPRPSAMVITSWCVLARSLSLSLSRIPAIASLTLFECNVQCAMCDVLCDVSPRECRSAVKRSSSRRA